MPPRDMEEQEMDTKHGSRVATRRVGLIVTVLVAALTLGACGTGGNEAAPVGDAAQGADPAQAVAVVHPVARENGGQKSDVALGDGSATTEIKALHRFGEVVEPGAGTGSWESMAEFLEFVLFDADGYWQWVFEQYGIQPAYVEYVFPAPGEVYETSCGSTNDTSAFYCPTDDLIVFSQQLAADLWSGEFVFNGRQVGDDSGDMAAALIVAHEFAHSLQGELGFLDGRYTTLQTELHADCWAGVWAASADDAGMLDDGDLDEAVLTAWLVGDTDRADRTHGTPGERMDAFLTGFDTAHPLMCGDFLEY